MRSTPFSFLSLALCSLVPAQTAVETSVQSRIRKEAFERSQVMASLQHLCDRIGSRLTGSEGMEKASQWARGKFQAMGLKAWQEGFKIHRSWKRQQASARLLAPLERSITLASGGWAPSTKGKVEAEVIDLSLKKRPAGEETGEAEKQTKTLVGKIVIGQLFPSLRRGSGKDPFTGAVARLLDSRKPHALLNMSSANGRQPYYMGTVPAAFITSEDFTLIRRLLKAGEKVVMEMEIRNQVSSSPVMVHNTVAELLGSDLKDEIVFAGGHLDSWDLASGTTDNGTGSMVVMEAARILSSLKQTPRRTIRFILFTGEEQGLVGSREYARAHEQEMPRYKAGLIMDIGTAKLLGLSMHGQEQLVPLFRSCLSAVEDLGLTDFNMRSQGGTDHLSFQPYGVPAFAFIHAKSEYNLTHHTQSDTYDKALEEDLKQAACVMATGLWELANVEGEIGRFDPEKAPRRGRGRGRRRRR